MKAIATAGRLVLSACVLVLGLGADVTHATDTAEMRAAKIRQLGAIEQRRRNEVLRLPGVEGIGTELSGQSPEQVVIRVYVKEGRATPAFKAQIESLLENAPVEILETPGFTAR